MMMHTECTLYSISKKAYYLPIIYLLIGDGYSTNSIYLLINLALIPISKRPPINSKPLPWPAPLEPRKQEVVPGSGVDHDGPRAPRLDVGNESSVVENSPAGEVLLIVFHTGPCEEFAERHGRRVLPTHQLRILAVDFGACVAF